MWATTPETALYDPLSTRFFDLFNPNEYDLLFEALRQSEWGWGFINRMEATWGKRCSDIREIRTIDGYLASTLSSRLRWSITHIFLHLARIHRVYCAIVPNQSRQNFSRPEQFIEAIIASMNDWYIRNRIHDQLDSLSIETHESRGLYRDIEWLYREIKKLSELEKSIWLHLKDVRRINQALKNVRNFLTMLWQRK